MPSAAEDHAAVHAPADTARYWRHPAAEGVELLKARFRRHAFPRHTHPTYALAVIEAGVEEYYYRGELHRVGPGDIGLVEPDTVHTGHAGVPDGWAYRVLYPEPALVEQIARDVGLRGGTPGFRATGLTHPEAAAHLRQAHRAAEAGDRLASSSLLRTAITHLLQVNAAPARRGPRTVADGAGRAARARELLCSRLVDPPSLEELAAEVGSAPFPLLRAFRSAYGLPPHAYLNQVRVQHARTLLAEGTPPAPAAAAVGFTDQPHLPRHFKRHLGVTPGAYRRSGAQS
jgi:AraC-like DNA-binding protein